MNWFTSRSFAKSSNETKASFVEKHECCDHVLENPTVLYEDQMECDSFGSEHYGVCEVCAKKAEDAYYDEEVVCDDCKQVFPRKETREWRWYDFYAPQGDEPLIVCEKCRHAEKHLTRVRRDREAYENE